MTYPQYKLLAFVSVGVFWLTVCLVAMSFAIPFFGPGFLGRDVFLLVLSVLVVCVAAFTFAMVQMRKAIRARHRDH